MSPDADRDSAQLGELLQRVRVEETPESPWRLSLRVPSWTDEAVLVGRGHRRPVRSGYAVVDAGWKPGDEVRLELPMRPRWTRPDPRVDAVRGCVAVERGPVVYCLESTDQDPGVSLAEVAADAGDGLADDGVSDALGGAAVVRAGGRRFDGAPASLHFISYHAWGNRGLSTMRASVPERDRVPCDSRAVPLGLRLLGGARERRRGGGDLLRRARGLLRRGGDLLGGGR